MTTTYEACGCGGTIVVTPARPGVEAHREHLNESGQPAACPSDR
ncbi:hypothetical protein AB0G64_11070 [Streptomyces longwoodensis]